jgi:hypothetical protein
MGTMKVLLWIKKEIFHVLPVFLFFLVFFTLINAAEMFLFERAGIARIHFTEIVVAAALVAKIFLVVDHLPIIHLFRRRPLAYGILWKTVFYWVLLFVVRILVRFVPFLFHGGSFQEDLNAFISHVNWSLFASVQIYYFLLLFIFVTFQELTAKIGPAKMRQLFFGKY